MTESKRPLTPPHPALSSDDKMYAPLLTTAKSTWERERLVSRRESFSGEVKEGPILGGTTSTSLLSRSHSITGESATYYVKDLTGHEKGTEARARIGLDIIRMLGINAPRAYIWRNSIATEKLDGFIPVLATRPEMKVDSPRYREELEANPHYTSLKGTYTLDIERQLIRDSQGKEYKISGNAFGASILALALGDDDFAPSGLNFGFVRVNPRGRFYTSAIDKDSVDFSSKDYADLKEEMKVILSDDLFKSATRDQELYFVHQLALAITPNAKGESKIDLIFNRPEFFKSKLIPPEECDAYRKFFSERIHSIVTEYTTKWNSTLEEFAEREKFRGKIADQVIAKLPFPPSPDYYNDLKRNIMDDLRGPYYGSHEIQLKNKELINTIFTNLKKEIYTLHTLEALFLKNIKPYQEKTTSKVRKKAIDDILQKFAVLKTAPDAEKALEEMLFFLKQESDRAERSHKAQTFTMFGKAHSTFSTLIENLLQEVGYSKGKTSSPTSTSSPKPP